MGLGCTSFYWISCTRSRYNYIQKYYVLRVAIFQSLQYNNSLHTGICVSFYFHIYIYSLEWDEIQWRDIGDDGAIALADPRVFKNFKTLK